MRAKPADLQYRRHFFTGPPRGTYVLDVRQLQRTTAPLRRNSEEMKKRTSVKTKPNPPPSKNGEKKDDDVRDSDEEGIVGWLKTTAGMEYMTMFVILNSIVVFTTMSWPQMKQMYTIISSYFSGGSSE
ncbi:hypothetical protein J437_LFUL010099 [Ladona fulva]|uniref:Uncharacterized protein n=1 Tax=Ladona fulva TaxID=123851 RepID=A0A8K0KBH3_LADFU|nr:hypothetical protein J437_LFUL010099 [Ladona fulva]